MGRDGFVLWTLSYVFTFILFRNFMTSELKNRMKKIAYYLVALFSLIFIPITFSRFFVGGDYSSVINSIINYFGQEFGNFNNVFNTITHKFDDVSRIFPILGFTSGNQDNLTLLERRELYFNVYRIDINVFSTFIGDLFLCMNTVLLIILSGFYGFILYLLFYKNTNVTFGKIILLVFFAQIPLHGLFYYKLSFFVSNIYMIFVLILSFLFYKKLVIKQID
jgi:hypothetical protein